MDVIRKPFAINTTPDSTPYTTGSCFALSGHGARDEHRMASYNHALEITWCESIETTLHTKRLLWAGALIRMSGERLPSESCPNILKGQCGDNGVGRRNSGPIAYRATSGRLA